MKRKTWSSKKKKKNNISAKLKINKLKYTFTKRCYEKKSAELKTD